MKEKNNWEQMAPSRLQKTVVSYSRELKKEERKEKLAVFSNAQQYIRRRYSIDDNGGGYNGL